MHLITDTEQTEHNYLLLRCLSEYAQRIIVSIAMHVVYYRLYSRVSLFPLNDISNRIATKLSVISFIEINLSVKKLGVF